MAQLLRPGMRPITYWMAFWEPRWLACACSVVILAFALLVGDSKAASADAPLNCGPVNDHEAFRPAIAVTKQRTALSLKRLQAGLEAGQIDKEEQIPITRISGITRVNDGDIIIFGHEERGTGVSAITADDIVVAMRTVLVSYQSPGMSIDPVKGEDEAHECRGGFEGTKQGRNAGGLADCQKVDYFGGIENTRIGKMAFENDYWMKLVAVGRNRILLRGFCSYADLLLHEGKTAMALRSGTSARFWFYPKAVQFVVSADGRVMQLEGGGVEILTEEEHDMFSATGSLISAFGRKARQPSDLFAKQLTDRYDELTTVNPSLASLRNFFALRALFVWLESKNPTRTNWSFLLSEYVPVGAHTTPLVPTIREPVTNLGTSRILSLEGGVSMEIRLPPRAVVAKRGSLEALLGNIMAAKSKIGQDYHWAF